MNEIDYPALYRAANLLSRESQNSFLRALRWHLIFLVIAAALSIANLPHWAPSFFQFLVLIGALGCSLYIFNKRPERFWYTGRAVAESTKTISWRYICRAEPFNKSDSDSSALFRKKIQQIATQNRSVSEALTENLGGAQLSKRMIELRGKSLDERKSNYLGFRIDNQLEWYSSKARFNRSSSRVFFFALIVINVSAVVFSAVRMKFTDVGFWPTDLFVAIAASLLSWMQAKRFSELAASYALTAQEIGFIKESINAVESETDFSHFVGDSENAFSREHTLWVARKDA